MYLSLKWTFLNKEKSASPCGRSDQVVALHVAELSRSDILEGRKVEKPVGVGVGGVGVDAGRVEPVPDSLNDLAGGIPSHGIDRPTALGGEYGGELPTARDRIDGPTAVEYAVMLALVVVACVVAIAVLGVDMSALFTTVGNNAGQ